MVVHQRRSAFLKGEKSDLDFLPDFDSGDGAATEEEGARLRFLALFLEWLILRPPASRSMRKG